MKNNTKLALALGGAVLAVLVIWLSLSNHIGTKKGSDVSLVTATQPPDLQSTISTTPIVSGPASDSLPAIVKTDASVTTQPAITGNVNTANDWTRLLQNGGEAQTSGQASGDSASASTQPAMLAAFTATSSSATTQPAEVLGDAVSATGRTHKVEPGESFYTIAASVYGDASLYTKIEDANPNVKPNRLRIGMVLNIPDGKGTAASHGMTTLAAVDSAPTAHDSSTTSTPKAEVDSRTSYRVRASDTLMSISRKLYGNGQSWEKIYEANRDSIGPNPARLKIDMVLRLPEPPTVSSTN